MFLTKEELRARRWRKFAELLAGGAVIIVTEVALIAMALLWCV